MQLDNEGMVQLFKHTPLAQDRLDLVLGEDLVLAEDFYCI